MVRSAPHSAVALGARAVLVGRAYLYGLAVAGEAGVRAALDILADELRKAMALSGASSLADLTPDMVSNAFERELTGATQGR